MTRDADNHEDNDPKVGSRFNSQARWLSQGAQLVEAVTFACMRNELDPSRFAPLWPQRQPRQPISHKLLLTYSTRRRYSRLRR